MLMHFINKSAVNTFTIQSPSFCRDWLEEGLRLAIHHIVYVALTKLSNALIELGRCINHHRCVTIENFCDIPCGCCGVYLCLLLAIRSEHIETNSASQW